MVINYDDYEKKQLDKAKGQQSQYANERNQVSQNTYDQIAKAIDTSTNAVKEGYQKKIDRLPQEYGSLYDANAVQEAVGRRQLEERMANMGITDSGLNRTQQTALTVQRGNADAAVRAQQQKAADELTQALNEVLANAAAQKQTQAANIFGQGSTDILNNRTSLYNNALNIASGLYGTDLDEAYRQAQLAEQKRQSQLDEAYRQAQLAEQKRQNAEYEKLRMYNTMVEQGYDADAVYREVFGRSRPDSYVPSATVGNSAGNAAVQGPSQLKMDTMKLNTSSGSAEATSSASRSNGNKTVTKGSAVSDLYPVVSANQGDWKEFKTQSGTPAAQVAAQAVNVMNAGNYRSALNYILEEFSPDDAARMIDVLNVPEGELEKYFGSMR